MQTQQKVTQPSRSGITFPEGEQKQVSLYSRVSLVSACRGNERMAAVLDFFLYRANWELENQHLPEGCKVVVLTRTHQQILEKLTFNLSRKSLIVYLDIFNEWGFVTSEKFHNTYKVDFEAVQTAIDTPPTPKARKSRRKGCKVEAITTDDNASTLAKKVEELQQKVELLQPYVEEVQRLGCSVTTLQRAFNALVETLQGHSEKDLSLLLSYYYPLPNNSLVAHATENAETDHDATSNTPPPSVPADVRTNGVADIQHAMVAHGVVRTGNEQTINRQVTDTQQTPLDLLPPCADETALATPFRGVPSASSGKERPPQVMTAKQIEKQTRLRANDIMALYCQLEGRQVMRSKPNLDGATALAENGALDEDITIVIRRIKQDAFWKKQMTLLTVVNQFDSRLDEEKLALQAQAPAPPSVPIAIAQRPIDPVVLENRRLAARFAQPQAEREA